MIYCIQVFGIVRFWVFGRTLRLILGIRTRVPHEWRKTINTKKPVRSQHNRAKENNSQKTKKNFTSFYIKDDPTLRGPALKYLVRLYRESKKWLRYGRANARCPVQGDDGLIEVSIEREWTVSIELNAGQSHLQMFRKQGIKTSLLYY